MNVYRLFCEYIVSVNIFVNVVTRLVLHPVPYNNNKHNCMAYLFYKILT